MNIYPLGAEVIPCGHMDGQTWQS